MAATVSIVVRAINATKAAFSEVGTQVTALNNSINAVGKAFKGIFIAGLIAQILKFFTSSTTESEKLKNSVDKISAPFKNIAQIVGNLLVKGINLIAPLIEKIGQAAEWAFGFFESESEKAARMAINHQKEIAKSEKEKSDESIKLAEKVAEQKLKYIEKVKDAELEAYGSEEELRQKTISEENKLAELKGNIASALRRIEDPKTDAITRAANRKYVAEARAAILDIEQAQQDRWNEEVQNAFDASDEQKKAWKEAEREKLEAAKDRIEETTKAEIDALEEQLAKAKQNQKELQEAATSLKELVVNDDARRSAKEEQKEKAKQERRFQTTLKEAERKEKEGRQLTETEQLAIAQRELSKAANIEATKQDQLQTKIAETLGTAATKLEQLDLDIKELMALKE